MSEASRRRVEGRPRLASVQRRPEVLQPDEAMRLTDQETLNLIFESGFSTAPEVTEVSGRGIGMDVVRTFLDRIREPFTFLRKKAAAQRFNFVRRSLLRAFRLCCSASAGV